MYQCSASVIASVSRNNPSFGQTCEQPHTCEVCDEPIPANRLAAVPEAILCVRCQSRRDRDEQYLCGGETVDGLDSLVERRRIPRTEAILITSFPEADMPRTHSRNRNVRRPAA